MFYAENLRAAGVSVVAEHRLCVHGEFGLDGLGFTGRAMADKAVAFLRAAAVAGSR